MLYREKPVVVEAFKYDGDFIYSDGTPYVPGWAMEADENGTFVHRGQGDLYIKTFDGEMLVNVGDYIARSDRGAVLVYPNVYFDQRYEQLEGEKMTKKQALNMSAEVQTISEVDQFLTEVNRRSLDHDVNFTLTKKPFGSESAEILYYSVPEAVATEENDEISDEKKGNIREDVVGMIRRATCFEQLKLELELYFEISLKDYNDALSRELIFGDRMACQTEKKATCDES